MCYDAGEIITGDLYFLTESFLPNKLRDDILSIRKLKRLKLWNSKKENWKDYNYGIKKKKTEKIITMEFKKRKKGNNIYEI